MLFRSPSARSEIRTVGVEVVNIFTDTTKETEENITCAIKKAIANSTTEFTGYTSKYEIILYNDYLKTYLLFHKFFYYMFEGGQKHWIIESTDISQFPLNLSFLPPSLSPVIWILLLYNHPPSRQTD